MKICLFLAPKTDKFLKDAVEVIETSRLQVAKQVNNVVMSSYWKIGKLLEDRKIDSKHGDGIVKRLSIDLKSKYPNMGLSQRNLWDLKSRQRFSSFLISDTDVLLNATDSDRS